MKTRAFAILPILLVLAVTALVAPKVVPHLLDGRTREADAAAKTVAADRSAEQAKAASVSASVNQIAVAAGQLPDSPQSAFITRETAFITPLLPPPDPLKLLAAERRRVALLEGKLEFADRLYRDGAKDNAALITRAVKAEAKAEEAIGQLQESAAYARGKDVVISILAAIAVLAVALWLYARFTSFGLPDLARMANRAHDIGGRAIEVVDGFVSDHLHVKVAEIAAKQRAEAAAAKAAREAAATH